MSQLRTIALAVVAVAVFTASTACAPKQPAPPAPWVETPPKIVPRQSVASDTASPQEVVSALLDALEAGRGYAANALTYRNPRPTGFTDDAKWPAFRNRAMDSPVATDSASMLAHMRGSLSASELAQFEQANRDYLRGLDEFVVVTVHGTFDRGADSHFPSGPVTLHFTLGRGKGTPWWVVAFDFP